METTGGPKVKAPFPTRGLLTYARLAVQILFLIEWSPFELQARAVPIGRCTTGQMAAGGVFANLVMASVCGPPIVNNNSRVCVVTVHRLLRCTHDCQSFNPYDELDWDPQPLIPNQAILHRDTGGAAINFANWLRTYITDGGRRMPINLPSGYQYTRPGDADNPNPPVIVDVGIPLAAMDA
ncbi:hypothetical protein HDV05_008305 [Chytridiales sp. JEL 0842]|nr:hypothetical protein HDV05_008305 [Chytridiales sp. JEL 0842]